MSIEISVAGVGNDLWSGLLPQHPVEPFSRAIRAGQGPQRFMNLCVPVAVEPQGENQPCDQVRSLARDNGRYCPNCLALSSAHNIQLQLKRCIGLCPYHARHQRRCHHHRAKAPPRHLVCTTPKTKDSLHHPRHSRSSIPGECRVIGHSRRDEAELGVHRPGSEAVGIARHPRGAAARPLAYPLNQDAM